MPAVNSPRNCPYSGAVRRPNEGSRANTGGGDTPFGVAGESRTTSRSVAPLLSLEIGSKRHK